MSFIFVSHASEDKLERVRPIVEVMVAEGESVWLDRPGAGDNNFGFDQAYISENAIDYLQSGKPWSDSLTKAIAQSGAVLGCLSKSLEAHREVIISELTVASAMGKLATCIIDDVEYSNLDRFAHGLFNPTGLQSPRIDTGRLRQALDLHFGQNIDVALLPPLLKEEWEKVRNLIANINRLRKAPRSMKKSDIIKIRPTLAKMNHGPIVKIVDIPAVILHAFGDHIAEPFRATTVIEQANHLITASTPDKELCGKLLLRPATLPNLSVSPADNFWSQAFTRAGLQSRRTVASLILNPTASWALQQASVSLESKRFIERLQDSHTKF